MICPVCSLVDFNLPKGVSVTYTCSVCNVRFPSVEAYDAHVTDCTHRGSSR
jgi:hypothetical protein